MIGGCAKGILRVFSLAPLARSTPKGRIEIERRCAAYCTPPSPLVIEVFLQVAQLPCNITLEHRLQFGGLKCFYEENCVTKGCGGSLAAKSRERLISKLVFVVEGIGLLYTWPHSDRITVAAQPHHGCHANPRFAKVMGGE